MRRALGGHVAQGVVQHLHLMLRALEEVAFRKILEAGVARHREIGQSTCSLKPAATMASYSSCIAAPMASTYASCVG